MAACNFNNLADQKFGRLIVMSRGPNDKRGAACWWCLCDCGNDILVGAGVLRSAHTKSCGCLQAERSSESLKKIACKWVGEKHPNWKGGISGERKSAMNQIEYKVWRTAVFQRDNFICQKCRDNRGGNLNAHHIESFAGNPELRTTVSNGITLCEVCHKDFHHQYGYTGSSQQLSVFIKEY